MRKLTVIYLTTFFFVCTLLSLLGISSKSYAAQPYLLVAQQTGTGEKSADPMKGEHKTKRHKKGSRKKKHTTGKHTSEKREEEPKVD